MRIKKEVVFWISGSLLLILTLIAMGYATMFILNENRSLQKEAPLGAEPVRFRLYGIDELGISGVNIDTIENAANTEIVPEDANAESE